MKEINRRYDPVRLSSIKRMLLNETKEGTPRYYEIWVDDVKMVEKTNEVEKFSSYEDHVFDETEKITINIFTSTQSSPHIVTRYNFTFEEDEKQPSQPMNGFGLGEIEARINEKVSQERERWDCDQVRKDLASAKEKLAEAEEYAEKLQTVIDETKTKLQQVSGMGEITSIIKDLAIPYLTGKKPDEKQTLSGSEKPQGEASFKMKSSEESNDSSEAERHLLEFGRSLRENFTQEEFEMILSIIDEFVKDKTNIKPVQELLNIGTNQQKDQKTK